MSNNLILVKPSKLLEKEILMYKQEHFEYGEKQIHGTCGLAYYDNFDEWLNLVLSIESDKLRNGGHIAYGIRPSERRKGYGKQQLELALNYAKNIGIREVIVACDKSNVASAMTAKSCGGILSHEFVEEGVEKQHYSIINV